MTIRAEDAPRSEMLEWWGMTAMWLAVAFVFALTQPAVSRPPPGFPTFIALSLTILGCALEAAAIATRVIANRPRWARTVAGAVVIVVVVVAGGVLVSRAPGREVLLGWITVPPAVGICAVAAAGRQGSWSSVAFLIATGVLVTLLGPRWIGA